MTKIRKKSAIPVYAVAVLWIFWAACLPMYKLWHFAWLVVLSFLLYKLASVFWRGKLVEVAEPEPEPEPTGNPELDALILQGRDTVRQLRELNERIQDKKLSAQIDRLEQLSRAIFAKVAKNPEKLPQIRKFMSYYLPTTLKLLNAYAELAGQSVRGKNITATMRRIESIMDTIVQAFEKQLDSLFGDAALDISTDITVLEGMLEREGLTRTGDIQNFVQEQKKS